jgi:uncharacterized protein YbbK (DUF523 family)
MKSVKLHPDEIRSAPVIVSACLLGVPCRYDGKHVVHAVVLSLLKQATYIPICPEVLGGLPIPRPPARFIGVKDGEEAMQKRFGICRKNGEDVTEAFIRGAEKTLDIAKAHGVRLAILKERSPSCGVRCIDREGQYVSGMGVTAARLRSAGVAIWSEQDVEAMDDSIK